MKPGISVVSLTNHLNFKAEIRSLKKSGFMALGLFLMMSMSMQSVLAANQDQTVFKGIPTQYIAALGDPDASSGSGAQSWGLWRKDPGPRGVWLKHFDQLQLAGGVAPAQWRFDTADWWLDENGLIMEKPEFSVPPGKYIVTGNRETMAVLTIHPEDANGERRWELDKGASLYDVTHLRCRSARYTPVAGGNTCSPALADRSVFRVRHGEPMPEVEGCNKLDYTVLFVVAVAVDNPATTDN